MYNRKYRRVEKRRGYKYIGFRFNLLWVFILLVGGVLVILTSK